MHPAVQHGGEAQLCPHPYHGDIDPALDEAFGITAWRIANGYGATT